MWTNEKKLQLLELLYELRDARIKEDADLNDMTIESINKLSIDDLYDLDDGDNLIQGIDIVTGVLE